MNYTSEQSFDIRIELAWGALNIGTENINYIDDLMIDYYEWRIEF